jgi:DNA-binding transcriptional LysR family regulator
LHASQTTGAYWLPQRLARFHAQYPDIDTDHVAAAVSSGRAEIGFVGMASDASTLTPPLHGVEIH